MPRGERRAGATRPARPVIAVASDAFKGTMTALQAATCMERGLRRALGAIPVRKIPMADGGGGTVQALVDATGGRFVPRTVRDPLGRPVRARFGILGDGETAVIEMAAASGLTLLKPAERDPMAAGTRGTGELVRHAMRLGAKTILVGIGGSATNDGGAGMARALGIRFLDAQGRELPEGGGALARLARIDPSGLDRAIARVRIEAACDVDNPLTGPHGAARVYGPQKGATPAMVVELDRGLRRLAAVVRRDLGIDVERVPGAGAAGGLGAGLLAFLGARLRPGVDIVIDAVGLASRLRGCDLAITGEGRMDGQTVRGKTVAGVARVARGLGIPVVAICGSVGPGASAMLAHGVDAFFSALREPMDEGAIRREGAAMLVECAEQVGRLLAVGGLTMSCARGSRARRGPA